jgi:hypothetical protein
MTTTTERTISILSAMQLLNELKSRADVPNDLRARAEQVMRHFPKAGDIASLAKFCEQHTLAPQMFCREDTSTPELAEQYLKSSKFDFK